MEEEEEEERENMFNMFNTYIYPAAPQMGRWYRTL
jgi:hypothetical protein